MKNVCIILLSSFLLFSCTIDVETNNTEPELKDINLKTISTQNTINLTWPPVEDCSWYFISIGLPGESLTLKGSYQNLISDTLSYDLRGLQKNTLYEIKVEGKDYLSGGKLIASKTITVSTKP
jgi:hypothetical protein